MMAKGNVKRLAAALAAVLALGVGYLAVDRGLRSAEKKQDMSEEEAQAAAVILAVPAAEISSLSFSGDEGRVTFRQDENGVWTTPGDEAFVMRDAAITRLTKDLSGLTATRRIEAEDDLAPYGLAEPAQVIDVETTDGSSAQIRLGIRNDSSRELYFALSQTPGTVYMTKTALDEHFSGSLKDFADYEDLPALTASLIRRIEVEKEDGAYVLDTPGDDNATVTGADGDTQRADLTLVGTVEDQLTHITWLKNVEYACRDFGQYGLGQPRATITVESEGEHSSSDAVLPAQGGSTLRETPDAELCLHIGAEDDGGNYYVRLGDSPQVHTVRRDYLETLVESAPEAFWSRTFSFVSIGDMAYLEVACGGQTYRLERISEDGLQDDAHLTWLVDGRPVSKESFTDFYYACVSVTAQERLAKVPEELREGGGAEPELVLRYHLTDGTQKTITYFDTDQNFCTVVYDDGSKAASVNRLYVKSMLEKLEALTSLASEALTEAQGTGI